MTTAITQPAIARAAPDAAALVAQAVDLLNEASGVMAPAATSPRLEALRISAPGQVLLDLVHKGREAASARLGLPVAGGRLVVVAGPEQVLTRLRVLVSPNTRSVEVLRDTE